MIKFVATKKWYTDAAKSETDILDISAGPSTLSVSNTPNLTSKDDLMQIRKLEGFATLLRMLRLNKGLSVEKLALEIKADVREIILLERQVGYKAKPKTLAALAMFYNIPKKPFLQISNTEKNIDSEMDHVVIRFVTESESFEKLTTQEKNLLNRTIGIISKKP